MNLSVREIQEQDIPLLVAYWTTAEPDFLKGMGVDLAKMPSANDFTAMLMNQLHTAIELKRSFCMIWELEGKPVGHSNTNPTTFGEEATMHLHIWKPQHRAAGMGLAFVKLTVPQFFEKLRLKTLFCEPYALNPAPNRTLEKAGFEFVKEYTTTPGSLNFEQPVKRWQMTYGRLKSLNIYDR